MKKLNIAIDGPAGAGKSTIARLISTRLGIIYLDTGAMYRAVALKAIRTGLNTGDRIKLSEMIENIKITVTYDGSFQKIFLDGEDVTEIIRTPEVSVGASNVAVIPEVRLKLAELQRSIASEHSIVMDGRDIGTYVLPNATFKFFLIADESERAKRRYKEEWSKGIPEIEVSYDKILTDIQYRDKNDSSRSFAPLKKAADAFIIDTTNLSINEVVDEIFKIMNDTGNGVTNG